MSKQNSEWWDKKEENAFDWHRRRGLNSKTTRIKAEADRIFLEKYALQNCVRDPIEAWYSDLEAAGFLSIERVWQKDMDTVIQAAKEA